MEELQRARYCAQLGKPPLLRLSRSVLESSARRAAAAVFCSRAQTRHPQEVPPFPPLPPPCGYPGNGARELGLKGAVPNGLVGVGLSLGPGAPGTFWSPCFLRVGPRRRECQAAAGELPRSVAILSKLGVPKLVGRPPNRRRRCLRGRGGLRNGTARRRVLCAERAARRTRPCSTSTPLAPHLPLSIVLER